MEKIISLHQLDLNGKYSYADYLTWRIEQALEIIKGKILPMTAPNRKHQKISWELNGLMYIFFKSKECQAFAAPFDVRLFDKRKSGKANKDIYTVVQPDICVVCDETKLDDAGCKGAPDLVLEILSPGNSKKEMKIKKELYEENAVREYWVIDPDHETVHQFVLNKKSVFDAPTIYSSDDILKSFIFKGFELDLEKLFA